MRKAEAGSGAGALKSTWANLGKQKKQKNTNQNWKSRHSDTRFCATCGASIGAAVFGAQPPVCDAHDGGTARRVEISFGRADSTTLSAYMLRRAASASGAVGRIQYVIQFRISRSSTISSRRDLRGPYMIYTEKIISLRVTSSASTVMFLVVSCAVCLSPIREQVVHVNKLASLDPVGRGLVVTFLP